MALCWAVPLLGRSVAVRRAAKSPLRRARRVVRLRVSAQDGAPAEEAGGPPSAAEQAQEPADEEAADQASSNAAAASAPENFEDLARKLGLEYLATFLDSVDLRGDWERDEIGGNYLLRPPPSIPPKGVIHFLGGAFVGAAPHILYRYFLESLASRGYVVVATPYELKFDYLETVDATLASFDKLSVRLALDYGPLPIIAVGHSAGALLHTISASLFDNADRAASVLISYNNKPVTEAIPLFKQGVTPLAEGTRSENFRTLREQTLSAAESATSLLESFAGSRFAPSLLAKDLIPLAKETLKVVEQVEPLIEDIANGRTEFVPTPDEVKMAAMASYATPSTLLIKFSMDSIDQTRMAEEILGAKTQLTTQQFTGTHITPLNQDPFAFKVPFDECIQRASFIRDPIRNGVLREVDELSNAVISWLDAGIQSGAI